LSFVRFRKPKIGKSKYAAYSLRVVGPKKINIPLRKRYEA